MGSRHRLRLDNKTVGGPGRVSAALGRKLLTEYTRCEEGQLSVLPIVNNNHKSNLKDTRLV